MIFIDTGAFLARHIARDQYHARATKAWARIGNEGVTSNFVLNETFTLLGRWVGYAFAAKRAHAIMASDALTILRPTRAGKRRLAAPKPLRPLALVLPLL